MYRSFKTTRYNTTTSDYSVKLKMDGTATFDGTGNFATNNSGVVHILNSAGYYQNKYVIESFGQVVTETSDQRRNPEPYKQNYYKSFEEFDFVFPLAKRTGFESLKFYLASITGNFDEFDEKYRVPLLNIAKETAWYNPRLFDAGSRISFSKKVSPLDWHGIDNTELEDIILNSVRETEPESCNVYSFDW